MVQETKPTSSLESPTMITVNGAAPVMAIVEDLTTKMCRLRSMSTFEVGSEASFEFTLRGAPKLPLAGRIESVAVNGPRRVYTISFAESGEQQVDRIAVVLDMARRFAESHHHDVQTGNGLTRSAVRVPLDAEVTYRWGDAPARTAHMTNISTGGILMNSTDDIPVGASLELRFALPAAGSSITVHARIVAHQTQSPNYNMAFYHVEDAARAAIAAYVESVRGGDGTT